MLRSHRIRRCYATQRNVTQDNARTVRRRTSTQAGYLQGDRVGQKSKVLILSECVNKTEKR